MSENIDESSEKVVYEPGSLRDPPSVGAGLTRSRHFYSTVALDQFNINDFEGMSGGGMAYSPSP